MNAPPDILEPHSFEAEKGTDRASHHSPRKKHTQRLPIKLRNFFVAFREARRGGKNALDLRSCMIFARTIVIGAMEQCGAFSTSAALTTH